MPSLTGLLVVWSDRTRALEFASSWPRDPRFHLVIIDNGPEQVPEIPGAIVLRPKQNLGFAGAVNLGLRHTVSPFVMTLNPDLRPCPAALERLLEGFALFSDASALAPSLFSPDGTPQHSWQLRRVPTLLTLLLQSLLLPAGDGDSEAPESGAALEQPAAAALAFRTKDLEALGGFDEVFFPAWFEDVDIAARMRDQEMVIRYCPESRFIHELGASIPKLGFQRFIWSYYRNLGLYLRKHFGTGWEVVSRCLLIPASVLRIVLLPVRKSRRAASRLDAVTGLLSLGLGALTCWRHPRGLATLMHPASPDPPGAD